MKSQYVFSHKGILLKKIYIKSSLKEPGKINKKKPKKGLT